MPRERLESAFEAIRRADFLPVEEQGKAAEDGPLPIGHGQTSSQPRTVYAMLELLDVGPGHRVLDVGCGSGWTTALLGHLVGPKGEVCGVEIVPELVTWGRHNLDRCSMPWTSISQASSKTLGLPERSRFDRILVSAEADSLPRSLVEQLGADGVMAIPVAGRMTRVRRTAHDVTVDHHGWYSFVPLVEPGAD